MLVNETFTGSSVPDPGFVPLNTACLTGAATAPPPGESTLGPCTAPDQTTEPVPPSGVTPGYLQLTDQGNYHVGSVLYNRPLPGNGGVQVTFKQYQYGGNGADGIGFFLVDGATDLTSAGADGGSLGYAQRNLTPGVDGGYLGLGLDAYGNFVNDGEQRGLGCPADHQSPVNPLDQVPNAITLRGPGQGIDGYCFLASTIKPDSSQPSGYITTLPGSLRADGTDPAASERIVRITVSAETYPLVTAEIDFEDGKGFQTVFTHRMDTAAPPTYKFGLSASTGGLTDTHLIRGLQVASTNTLDQLNLVKTVVDEPGTPYRVGDTVHYQFLVTNTGTTDLTGVQVHDPAVTDVICPRDTLGFAGTATASMVCTGTHVITTQDSLTGTFTNTAQAQGLADQTPVESNQSSAEVPVEPLTADLRLGKTADPTTVEAGHKVTYTLTVTNHSAFPLTPAEASDDLSNVLHYASYDGDATASTGSVSVTGSTLTWTGDLAVDASATITYSVTTHSSITSNQVTRNGVTSSIPATRCMVADSDETTEPPCVTEVHITPAPVPSPKPSTPAPSSPAPNTPAPTSPPHIGGLARTGLDTAPFDIAAGGLLACGLVLRVVARNRSRRPRHQR